MLGLGLGKALEEEKGKEKGLAKEIREEDLARVPMIDMESFLV